MGDLSIMRASSGMGTEIDDSCRILPIVVSWKMDDSGQTHFYSADRIQRAVTTSTLPYCLGSSPVVTYQLLNML